jgi:hypothetical protein
MTFIKGEKEQEISPKKAVGSKKKTVQCAHINLQTLQILRRIEEGTLVKSPTNARNATWHLQLSETSKTMKDVTTCTNRISAKRLGA